SLRASAPTRAGSRPRPMGVSPRDTVARRRPSSMGCGTPFGGADVGKTVPPDPLDTGHGRARSIRPPTQGIAVLRGARTAREVVRGDISDREDPQRGAR